MEAEIGVMLPQTKEDLRASETGRGEKEAPVETGKNKKLEKTL